MPAEALDRPRGERERNDHSGEERPGPVLAAEAPEQQAQRQDDRGARALGEGAGALCAGEERCDHEDVGDPQAVARP